MTEANFQQEIKESINWLWPEAFYHKLTDTPIFKGSQIRMAHPKPFDCFFIESGIGYALELKQHKLKAPFPFNKVKPHQIEGLLGWKMSGGRAYLLINIRLPERLANQVFAFEISQWTKIQREHPNWKSVNLVDMAWMAGKEINREQFVKDGEKKTIWNLLPLVA